MNRKILSTIIREARGERSQGRFARDLGVNPGTIRNWELQESEPGLDGLKAIADASGRTLLQLIAEITGETLDSRPEPKVAEDVMAIAKHLDKAEQFRLVQLLLGEIANLVGIDIE